MAFRLSIGLRNALLGKEALVNALTLHVNSITFGDGDGTGGNDTITDGGSGLASHTPGDKITIGNSLSNNTTVEILSVTAGVIEVPAGSLSGEVATARTIMLASCRGGSMNDIFRNGVMRIYTGTQPSTAELIESGSLLVEITQASGAFVSGSPENGLNFGEAASNAVLGKHPDETWSGVAGLTGTAGWFRFYPNDVDTHIGAAVSGNKIRFDGSIATSGAQLNMSNTSITSGGTTTIDSVAISLPTY